MIRVAYNPQQALGGVAQISKTKSGCDTCTTLTECKYETLNLSATVTSITFVSAKTGTSVVKTIGAYSTRGELTDLLIAAFESEGFVVSGTESIRVRPNAVTAANTDITFIGEAVVTKVNAITLTPVCTPTLTCSYVLSSEGGTALPFVNDLGVTNNVTFDDQTTAATLQSTIAGHITGEVSVNVKKSAANVFTITIKHRDNKTFSLDSIPFVKTMCELDYV